MSLSTIILRDMGFMCGAMAESTRELGKIIKWRARASLLGLTDESILETTSTIKKKAMVSFTGRTVANTMECGWTGSKTESEPTLLQVGRQKLGSGKTAGG